MALGRRKKQKQDAFWVAADELPKSAGHVFYRKLNQLLAEAGFDEFVETECETYYASGQGRPSIPPGVYFRMLLVGFFEGIGSQRGIAWRCSDSLSLRDFLGLSLSESSPDHSSLTRVRDRLPLEVHMSAFLFVLQLAGLKQLLRGQHLAVDATNLEANAAMKSIVRKDTGDDWKAYLTKLIGEEEGKEDPTDEELRRFDKRRKNKKVSNSDWESPHDPDSRIARMKDGRTHLAYKAEHVVDVDSDLIIAAEIYHADQGDTSTIEDSIHQAETNLQTSLGEPETSETHIKKVAADKGYHSSDVLLSFDQHTPYKLYIPEPDYAQDRRWTDKSPDAQRVVYNNRRRIKRPFSKAFQKQRSEYAERSFAHVCETGGARRSWLRGQEKNQKRYLIAVAARNLATIMRKLFKMGTPRGLMGVFASHFGFVLAHIAFYFTTTGLKQLRAKFFNQHRLLERADLTTC